MKYTINGSTVLLNKDILSEESLNTMIKEIDSSYESCSKAIEAYDLVSNVKTMESFGYKTTEGLGKSIANGAKVVWEQVKIFIQKVVQFVNGVSSRIKSIMFKKRCEETVKLLKSPEIQKVLALPNKADSAFINSEIIKLLENAEVVEEGISKTKILNIDLKTHDADLYNILEEYGKYGSGLRKFTKLPSDETKAKLRHIPDKCYIIYYDIEKALNELVSFFNDGGVNLNKENREQNFIPVSKANLLNYLRDKNVNEIANRVIKLGEMCESIKDRIGEIQSTSSRLKDFAEDNNAARLGMPRDSGLRDCVMRVGGHMVKMIKRYQSLLDHIWVNLDYFNYAVKKLYYNLEDTQLSNLNASSNKLFPSQQQNH